MVDRVGLVVGPAASLPKTKATAAQPKGSETSGTYDSDVYLRACEQAEHIRAGRFDQVDLKNAADEIDDVGLRQYDAVVSKLRVILTHMLKWELQPTKRSRSLMTSIYANRDQVDYHLDRSRSLKAKQDEWLPKAYKLVRRRASLETGIDISAFPESCPYSWDEITKRPFVLNQTNSEEAGETAP